MAHRNARLTPLGRRLLVDRVIEMGWSPAAVADAFGVSRATVYKWLRRWREDGPEGLADRSSRPKRCPGALPLGQQRAILAARRRHKVGPHQLVRYVPHPRSTIYAVLRRHGTARLDLLDRPTGVPIRRYQKDRPGELLHVDVKKLARIPAGGGHKMRGRSAQTKTRDSEGYDYIHSAIDDRTRLAFSQILHDETGTTCARFLADAAAAFAGLGICIEAVMTDEAKNYTRSKVFAEVCSRIGARHVTTGPYRPRINGKVERFNRTLVEEWAYAKLYRSNAARQQEFYRWLKAYNHTRPHTALGGQSPMQFLNNVRGNYT